MIIPDEDRPQHIYVPGKTRYGKSNCLFWMALQDIARGKGVCVMDAKGDLVNKLLSYIPKYRVDDTVALDMDNPIPLDFMGYRHPREKEAVAGEIKYALMKSVESQHAPVVNANLTDVIYTLFDYNETAPPHCRATFLDIYEFLENEERRNFILGRVRDETLQRRWRDNFPNPVDRSRITTRMTPFIRSASLRKIFGAKNPVLNIADCMDQKKVLLVNLGPIDEIQRIYGTLLLAQIRQAAYRRVDPKHPRTPFHLYADEFQEFQTSDFDQMLSMAGGLGLYLTLAHQFTDQLEPRIRASIKGNVSTFIIFRSAYETAVSLIHEIPPMEAEWVWKRDPATGAMGWLARNIDYDAADLSRLRVGSALYRAADGSARYIRTLGPPEPSTADYAETIKKRTIERYACNAAPVCSTRDDAPRHAKSDDIEPGPAPRIPPHRAKKKNA